MRSAKQIESEIKKLRGLLNLKDRWNQQSREKMEACIEVLSRRMSAKEVELQWYEDETTEDYHDGDNDLWFELNQTVHWMNGEKGYEAPSYGAV